MKKILSLDGGGIRGVTTAHFLEMIEADLKKPLSECFDLFAGTSTGCIISGLIGIKGMSAHDVADMYNYHNSNQMMNKSKWDIKLGLVQNQPKYDGRGKWSVIKKEVNDGTFDNKNVYSHQKESLFRSVLNRANAANPNQLSAEEKLSIQGILHMLKDEPVNKVFIEKLEKKTEE